MDNTSAVGIVNQYLDIMLVQNNQAPWATRLAVGSAGVRGALPLLHPRLALQPPSFSGRQRGR
jgi:hypothetical protein